MNSNPRVLFFPFDLMSHYLRSLVFARHLSDQFEIYYLASMRYDAFVRAEGFATVEGKHFDTEQVLQEARRFSFKWLGKTIIRELVASHRQAIQMVQPALVVGDTFPTVRIAAEAEGVPYVSIMNGYMSRYFALLRPVPSSHPANQWRGRVPQRFFDSMARIAEQRAFREIHTPFRELRRELRLASVADYLEELQGETTLICDLPELFPQKNLPSNHWVIGPLNYRGQPLAAEVEAFLNNGKPTMLVTVGSSGNLDVFQSLIERKFKTWNVIITGDERQNFAQPNIIAQPFLNLSALMDHVDIVLTHGGNGSIYQALAGGVPVLCRPVIFEQEWNVHRIVELGLGEWLPDKATGEDLFAIAQKWQGMARTGNFLEFAKRIRYFENRLAGQIQNSIDNLFNTEIDHTNSNKQYITK